MKGVLHYDTHIEVEEKVLTYSKFHLLEGSTCKQYESKILMLRNQNTYFSMISTIKVNLGNFVVTWINRAYGTLQTKQNEMVLYETVLYEKINCKYSGTSI